ncbi:MAG: Rieske 2Fe-2S domain-containing protein [Acidobacteria bacterium]|nr:Rieske 2Fe-2S domain-containing protein [Acidobacteriota bacterium]MBI3661570.1 Rieske 2Fe-2S domain-containing protein [Acidobacteriota bacterium]
MEKTVSGNGQPEQPGRRRMLGFLVGSGVMASLASFVYPILRFVLPPQSGELDADTVAAKANELAANAAKIFRMGNRPGILIRMVDGTYRAFAAVCTHLNCTVQYRQSEHDIWCACHNGVYNLQGGVVSGPPPKALEQFEVHTRGQEIIVSKGSRS